MLHRVDLKNNVAPSNTIQYFRHIIAYYYLPCFTSPTKEEHERLGAAIAEGAAQQGSNQNRVCWRRIVTALCSHQELRGMGQVSQ